MVVALEDGGFEVRDMIAWIFSTGFPKSVNLGERISKQAGTEAGTRWAGWGTALKPAVEPIVLARKPLIGKIAENVVQFGTGGLNVDRCRVPICEDDDIFAKNPHTKGGFGHGNAHVYGKSSGSPAYDPGAGRWPANFVHDGSAAVLELLGDNDGNNAARFFYCAKASSAERGKDNNHPTVKPIALMEYLISLVCPPHGIVLDPFCGSGSTLIACENLGVDWVACDMDAESVAIAKRRLERWQPTEKNSKRHWTNNKRPKQQETLFDPTNT
jgi:site-specific DNA-methyltransferase (adenine-specific)